MLPRFKSAIFALALSLPIHGWTQEWHSYRNDPARSGEQRVSSRLSSPTEVPKLQVGWAWPKTEKSVLGSFRASPIVHAQRVFIGSTKGYFYALKAATGQKLWRFPGRGRPALLGSCGSGDNGTWGQYGIQSSASYAKVKGKDAVIFGAPDPTAETGLGSARLFALSMSGKLLWKSDVVAHVNGCPGSPNVLHERIAYSSPLVVGGMVYVGIHDAGDDPIQNGKVVAVDLNTGHIVPGFNFHATAIGTRGGGVWNSPASDQKAVYFTTGNTRSWNGGSQPEPHPNYGLSALRVNKLTGHVDWQFQPVPYNLDDDPDWAAGAAVMSGSCGKLITSVQKDGWSYALDAANGNCIWQYPPTAGNCKFSTKGPHAHGDTDYKQPGAIWKDVIIMKVGGWDLIAPGSASGGYTKLHALEACAKNPTQRVRWMITVPSAGSNNGYSIGAPTVTGGIVYVTTNKGHVVAIADTSLVAPMINQCTFEFINPTTIGPTWATVCTSFGFQVVPVPIVLADVPLPDAANGANAANLRNEAAIAEGRLYVGTSGGHVYALWPH